MLAFFQNFIFSKIPVLALSYHAREDSTQRQQNRTFFRYFYGDIFQLATWTIIV